MKLFDDNEFNTCLDDFAELAKQYWLKSKPEQPEPLPAPFLIALHRGDTPALEDGIYRLTGVLLDCLPSDNEQRAFMMFRVGKDLSKRVPTGDKLDAVFFASEAWVMTQSLVNATLPEEEREAVMIAGLTPTLQRNMSVCYFDREESGAIKFTEDEVAKAGESKGLAVPRDLRIVIESFINERKPKIDTRPAARPETAQYLN